MKLKYEYYAELINMSLKEDLGGPGDITSLATVDPEKEGEAILKAKEDGVICGLEIFCSVFKSVNNNIDIRLYFKDGDKVSKNDIIAKITGKLQPILTAERTALNFIQRLSGISSYSAKLAGLVKNTHIKILDTRKTAPGYRMLEKYAVYCGGASNHRIGLYDLFMIKDNHIEGAGSITNAVEKVRKYREINNLKSLIEVEVKNLEEFKIAYDLNVDIIMLDNMSPETIRECTYYNKNGIKLEVSGNMNEEKIMLYLDLGIDYISSGALTHSYKSLDLSLLVK